MTNSISILNSRNVNEEQVCENVIMKFGQAMLDHDIKVLQELYEDFYANVLRNFNDPVVIKKLTAMTNILFQLDWNDWDESVIDEYVNALGNGENRLMAKYS